MKKYMMLLCAVLVAVAAGVAQGAGPTRGLPDLVVLKNVNPYVSAQRFNPTDCAVQEGMITEGVHKLVRFNTLTENRGPVDLVVGHPDTSDTTNWEYFACHGHWHFKKFAEYTLTDAAGNVVGTGHKQSFCIEDTIHTQDFGPKRWRYTCKNQGITTGWTDEYDSSLDGQWIVIDGLAPGTYNLSVTVNYAGVLTESNYSNNTTTVPVVIP